MNCIKEAIVDETVSSMTIISKQKLPDKEKETKECNVAASHQLFKQFGITKRKINLICCKFSSVNVMLNPIKILL